RYVEENIAAAVIRAQKAEALRLEIGDHAAGLLSPGGLPAGLARFGGSRDGLAGLIAHALLDQRQIGFRPIRRRTDLGGNLKFGVALPRIFKQSLLACVQRKYPRNPVVLKRLPV